MAKSTQLIADLTTVIANGPQGGTPAMAIAPSGAIMDYPGNCKLVLLNFQEAAYMLGGTSLTITGGIVFKGLKGVTDAGDTANLALIGGVLALINGTAAPSTQALTDMATLRSNVAPGGPVQPDANTVANCNAAGGPLLDYGGCIEQVRRAFQQASVTLSYIRLVTDQTFDATNWALIAKLLNALDNTTLT